MRPRPSYRLRESGGQCSRQPGQVRKEAAVTNSRWVVPGSHPPRLTSRAALKAATRDAHERVDAAYSCFDLADPSGYSAFLTAHSAVLPTCEQVLTASGIAALVPAWPAHQRSAMLYADLAAIDGTPAKVDPGTALDTAAAFGMMYVLEGSRLGGAVLARRVAANTDARCRAATTYLRHGEGSGLWPSFVAMFDTSPEIAQNFESVVSSALVTFDLFLAAAIIGTKTHMD